MQGDTKCEERLGNDASSGRGKPGTPTALLPLDFLSSVPDPRHEVCGQEEPLGSVCVCRACAVACGSSFGFPMLVEKLKQTLADVAAGAGSECVSGAKRRIWSLV